MSLCGDRVWLVSFASNGDDKLMLVLTRPIRLIWLCVFQWSKLFSDDKRSVSVIPLTSVRYQVKKKTDNANRIYEVFNTYSSSNWIFQMMSTRNRRTPFNFEHESCETRSDYQTSKQFNLPIHSYTYCGGGHTFQCRVCAAEKKTEITPLGCFRLKGVRRGSCVVDCKEL